MTNEKTVVLVHGLWMNSWSMKYLGRFLKKRGYRINYFTYPSVRYPLEKNIEKLRCFIEKTGSSEISLVGHSLGGILAINYLQKYGDQGINACVLLGSPVQGSQAAKGLARFFWGNALLGQSFAALSKAHKIPYSEKISIIQGVGGRGLGRLFTALPEPHDGAVAYSETLSNDLIHQKKMPVSHSSMLISRPVANAVCAFLEYKHF